MNEFTRFQPSQGRGATLNHYRLERSAQYRLRLNVTEVQYLLACELHAQLVWQRLIRLSQHYHMIRCPCLRHWACQESSVCSLSKHSLHLLCMWSHPLRGASESVKGAKTKGVVLPFFWCVSYWEGTRGCGKGQYSTMDQRGTHYDTSCAQFITIYYLQSLWTSNLHTYAGRSADQRN